MAAHPESVQGLVQDRASVRGNADRKPRDTRADRSLPWLLTVTALLCGCLLLIMQLLAPAPAFAQSVSPYSDAAYGEPGSIDPPGRVGWLSYIEGRVGHGRDDGDQDTRPAELNWPVTAGDRLVADRQGRFELRIGSIAVRGEDTEIAVRALDDERLRLEQLSGSIAISFESREQAEGTELETPFGRVDFALPGNYRIEVRERPGELLVTTFSGAAYVHADGLSVAVPEGRRAEVQEGGDYLVRGARRDAFDAWVSAREARDDQGRRQAREYVSSEMTGAESLSTYGSWSSEPSYGAVWTPYAQPVGWAPYRYGRWAWVHPWGWTWIDAAPWGFAPFHYGRWLIVSGRWSWIPGHHAHRPVFAPALVVWVGGSNWSFSHSSGPSIGWFPLGPHEVYVPPRHFSHRYAYRVNRPSVTERAIEVAVRLSERPEALHEQRFRHRDEPRAVTIVPERTLSIGQAVQRQAIQLRERREWRTAPLQVAPTLRPAPVAERPRRGNREDREDRDEMRGGVRAGARDEIRNEGRNEAHDSNRGGRRWRDRAEQLANPVLPPVVPPAARPEPRPDGVVPRDPQRRVDMHDEREGREDREGRNGRESRGSRDDRADRDARDERRVIRERAREPSEPREFRQRQPGPPPGQQQVRPLGPMNPPSAAQPPTVQPPAMQLPPVLRPNVPAATPAQPPVRRQEARPPQVFPPVQTGMGPPAGGSPVDRAREQARRVMERERNSGSSAARVEERREGRREVRQDEQGAGSGQGSGGEQGPWWRKRLDQRRQDERP